MGGNPLAQVQRIYYNQLSLTGQVRSISFEKIFGKNFMTHTSACFVGEAPPLISQEQPNRWYGCRVACDEHKQQALLESGENLYVFLDRREDKTHPLEGSGLNYLINPVGILNHRAWCDFLFETPTIYEEIFSSETYFDFYIQHAEDIEPFFYAFYRKYQKSKRKDSFFEVLLALRKSELATEKYLNLLLNMWNLQLVLQNELKMQGLSWVKSPDHARETFLTVYEQLNEETLLADVVNDMFKRLVKLGDQRFAHFNEHVPAS
ncbi:MAG TPA: hypothetical protein VI451_20320 [Anaerolineales bacterium]|nr:hypothetical protein [Anaerolineales bacterium]